MDQLSHSGVVSVDDFIHTDRLSLRSWRADDAPMLLPVLQANEERLLRWIPPHVGSAAPLDELRGRLAGFADDFRAMLRWRFGIFTQDQRDVFGEVDLFFRSEAGRVTLAEADRTEIGYWLREDVGGRGYATEAARAMMSLTQSLPGMRHIEIRCDSRNEPSMAVARRLGFHLTTLTVDSFDVVWTYEL